MNKNHPTTAGKVLKQLMFKHDINESQLSHLTSVSKSNISRLKNDPQCNPTLNTLIPIAKYFRITVSELIGEEFNCNQYHQKLETELPDSQFFDIFTKNSPQQNRMKPFLNIDEIQDYEVSNQGSFVEKFARISNKTNAKQLSYSISVVPPGGKACPFHNHHINEEMFLILEGEGTLRYGTKTYKIKKHDIIACPAGGKEEAHQILNTSDNDLKYLCLSTNLPYDICEYPDSNKIMCKASSGKEISVRKIFKQEDNVDYMVREE